MFDFDCANCDYSTDTIGGSCCRSSDDVEISIPVHTIPYAPSLPIEKMYTESEVKRMVDQAIEKSEAKCLQYKQELMEAYQQNQKLVELYNRSRN